MLPKSSGHLQPARASCLASYEVINKILPPSHGTWWVNCRQMWAEGGWGMKRDLYAHNEENENKCANQVSSRCWVTLVNSRHPCGICRRTPSPQDFLPGGTLPTCACLWFEFGWDQNFPEWERFRNSSRREEHQTQVTTSKQRQELGLGRTRYGRFLCFFGDESGMPGLGVWSYLRRECKGRSLEGLFKKELCRVCLKVTELASSPKMCWGACNPWEPSGESPISSAPAQFPWFPPRIKALPKRDCEHLLLPHF